jgi:hypothetical protein
MAGPGDRMDEAALWRRWRSASALVNAAGAEPDALLLAAYAENRLPEQAAEAVEDWLADHPETASDVLAARRVAHAETPAASPAVMARAASLVAAGEAQVVTFRRPPSRMASWRAAAMWSGMAASLVVTSLIGFTLGNSAYVSLVGGGSPAFGQELFDPPTGLFNSLDEEPST